SKGAGNSPSEDEIINTLKKEQKKRAEAAELYLKVNDEARTRQELYEKEVIAKYLPETMDEAQLRSLVDQEINKIGGLDNKNIGRVIGAVKQACGPAADGSLIAKIVKERL
ncbi:GatB/YqeY domain-containing protein, partial [Candidatus Parcubacteria bacterium]|nr:GatB/YqeY domain-containing protein [Candidatus Parcubacteria bacterium]